MVSSQPRYEEDELLPLSALQHLQFCERQCALIHLEGMWDENWLTAEGRLLHDRVHDGGDEIRDGVRVVRGLRLHSRILGLFGIADIVEFRQDETRGTVLPSQRGLWQPFPIEYKRGRPKPDDCDRVQLCAQAICLEEMLGVDVEEGSIFYGQPRRREAVEFGDRLRDRVTETAANLHALIERAVTPAARFDSRCRGCSLMDLCMPKRSTSSVAAYLTGAFDDVTE